MQRANYFEGLEDHHIQRALQKIEFGYAHPCLLWLYHISISQAMWLPFRKRPPGTRPRTRRAALDAYPPTEPRQHEGHSQQPHHDQKRGGAGVLKNVDLFADDAERSRRREMHCPHSVENRAHRQKKLTDVAVQIQYLVVALPR